MTNIGVFDSGLGGLTVLKELASKKNANYFYLGDSKRAPYGSRSKEEILKLTDEIVEYLEKYDIDQYIIACNTISTIATEYLENKYKKKFYPITRAGVENALQYEGDFCLLATKATVDSHIYKEEIEKNSSSKVFEIPATKLVTLIEDGKLNGDELDQALSQYLEIANQKKIPNIILGCTHYPIIKNAIIKNLNYKANILNPAHNVSKKVNFDENNKSSINIFMTQVNEKNKQIVDHILDCDYNLELKEI